MGLIWKVQLRLFSNWGRPLKKHIKVPKGEKDPAKAIRIAKVKAAEKELTAAKVAKSTAACLVYMTYFAN